MFRYHCIPLILCILFTFTGCWDSHDIEQLSFVVGSAFDKVSSGTSTDKHQKKNKIKLTLQSISNIQESTPSTTKKKQPKKYKNISGTGDSLLQIIRELSLKSDRIATGAHLKLTVVSADLAKEISLPFLLAFHARSYEIRDSSIFLIAQGSAADTLNISADIPSFELAGIGQNKYKTSQLLPTITHGKIQSLVEANASFIVQSVKVKNKKFEFNGGHIVKGKLNKVVGFLNKKEVEGVNWITGNVKGGIIKGKDPKTNGSIVYEISSVTSKITPHMKNNHISFDVDIQSFGRLSEDWVNVSNAFSNKFIKRAEIAIKKEVERLVNQTLTRLQNEYGTDVVNFGNQLRIHYPKEWKRIRNNWDNQFQKVPVRVNVEIAIHDYMDRSK